MGGVRQTVWIYPNERGGLYYYTIRVARYINRRQPYIDIAKVSL
jgi:hypothetical protein